MVNRTAAKDGLEDIRAIAEPVWHSTNGVMPTKTAGVTPKRKSKREVKPDTRGFRWQVRTWLDANKPDQLDLGRWIHELKCQRTFAPILRNALILYRELMIGEVDMLYQLFPDIKPPPPVPPAKIEDMQKKIDSLQDQVDLLKGILIKQSGPGAVDMGVKMADDTPAIRTPRVLSKPPIVVAAPVVREVDTSEAFLNAF